VLIKYAADNGFGVIMDTSQPWPQSPVVWWGEAVDVTKPVVDLYNAQSGVPAPATTGAAPKPPAPGRRPPPSRLQPPSQPTLPNSFTRDTSGVAKFPKACLRAAPFLCLKGRAGKPGGGVLGAIKFCSGGHMFADSLLDSDWPVALTEAGRRCVVCAADSCDRMVLALP